MSHTKKQVNFIEKNKKDLAQNITAMEYFEPVYQTSLVSKSLTHRKIKKETEGSRVNFAPNQTFTYADDLTSQKQREKDIKIFLKFQAQVRGCRKKKNNTRRDTSD